MKNHQGQTSENFEAGALWQTLWVRGAIVVGVWTLLGVIYAAPIYVEVTSEGMSHAAWRVFSWGILTWLAWAPLTPLITWLGRRFSFVESSWKTSLLVHVPSFVTISAIHSAVAAAITLLIRPFDNMDKGPTTFMPRFLSRFKGSIGGDLLIYAGIIGVYYAIDYYFKYREREFRAAQLETQLAVAQLDSLRMQLHPHFLFNTLNGIVGLVRDNRNQAAVGMLVGLSDLLRHALEHSNEQEVTLKEELDFIQIYLNIQQMRFSDRLKVETDIDPKTLKALVPNLLLQPLAENAIKHGFSQRSMSGLIRLTSHIENGHLHLAVLDDGAGLPGNWQMKSSVGIGIANTVARLQQLYNGEHRFNIRNREDVGVEVTVVIPFHTSSGDRDD